MRKFYPIPSLMKPAMLAIFCLSLCLILSGCKKEDDDDDDGGNNIIPAGYRLKEWKYYDEGVLENNVKLIYSGSRVTEIDYYTAKGKDPLEVVRKMIVEYAGDQATITDYWVEEGGAFYPDTKEERTIVNDLVTEIREYDYNGTYTLEDVSKYSYTGNLLTQTLNYDGSNQEPSGKSLYYYDSNKISKEEFYIYTNNAFSINSKTVYTYSGDDISLVAYYNFNQSAWTETFKDSLSYNGNQVTIKGYENNSGTWDPTHQVKITTDAYGNTTELVYSYYTSTVEKAEFFYEAGTGNFEKIMFDPESELIPWILPFK